MSGLGLSGFKTFKPKALLKMTRSGFVVQGMGFSGFGPNEWFH